MKDTGPLTRALDSLERVQVDLASIATRTDDERRSDLVKLRRELSVQIALIGQIAEPFFADAPESFGEFRRRYSAMRSAAALHQAEWPAVRLGEFDNGYDESAQGVRAANRAFGAWLRGVLAEMVKA